MYCEYSTVKAKEPLSNVVKKGSVGIVLMVHIEPNIAYEVEFFNEEGKTLEVLTVKETNLELL